MNRFMWILTAVMAGLLAFGGLSYALSNDEPGAGRPGGSQKQRREQPVRLEEDDVVVPLEAVATPTPDEDEDEDLYEGSKHDTKDSKHDTEQDSKHDSKQDHGHSDD